MNKFITYMNKLSENVLLINPPRKALLSFYGILALMLFIIMVLTFNVFMMFSLPFLFLWMFIFSYFIKVWSAFKYSKIVIFSATILVASLGLLSGNVVRSLFVKLLYLFI